MTTAFLAELPRLAFKSVWYKVMMFQMRGLLDKQGLHKSVADCGQDPAENSWLRLDACNQQQVCVGCCIC